MKCCSKCGSAMNPDASFCHKCGTEYVGAKSTIEKLKSIQMVIPYDTVTWEYITKDAQKAANLSLKQDNLKKSYQECVSDLLSDPDITEELTSEVYEHTLSIVYDLLVNSEKLFENYRGLQELFDQGMNLYQKGLIEAEKALEGVKETDYAYKVFSGLYYVQAVELIRCLDSGTLSLYPRFVRQVEMIASQFVNTVLAEYERNFDFYINPSEKLVYDDKARYETILSYLSDNSTYQRDASAFDSTIHRIRSGGGPRAGSKNAIRNDTKSEGGCYIATAVYGAYDCPQVLTLRRYRDNYLVRTWCGRLFVSIYYAISPILVKWFGNSEKFKKFWKKRLDKFVDELNEYAQPKS